MIIDGVTGNITRMPDSVVLNIENSSSTNTSSSDHDYNYVNDDLERNIPDDEEGELHCDDWEIRMLAAELNRRESKIDEPMSSETTSDADGSNGLLRQRTRLRSDTIDTDTEYGEGERDPQARPRAASLDQYNLQRRNKSKGVFKAMSFDRDKDRL